MVFSDSPNEYDVGDRIELWNFPSVCFKENITGNPRYLDDIYWRIVHNNEHLDGNTGVAYCTYTLEPCYDDFEILLDSVLDGGT
eukprot:UN09235